MNEAREQNSTVLSAKAYRSLDQTDTMSPELRACVHEFGSQIVNTLLQRGVCKPVEIRAVVLSCWSGAREPHQRHGNIARGPATFVNQLDWLLEQRGAPISAATLLRMLQLHGMVIIPLDPSALMVEASMATVANHDVMVTKYEKHKRRLKAGIDAVARRLWPMVFPA